jgi:hypothetical protein
MERLKNELSAIIQIHSMNVVVIFQPISYYQTVLLVCMPSMRELKVMLLSEDQLRMIW